MAPGLRQRPIRIVVTNEVLDHQKQRGGVTAAEPRHPDLRSHVAEPALPRHHVTVDVGGDGEPAWAVVLEHHVMPAAQGDVIRGDIITALGARDDMMEVYGPVAAYP